MNSRVDPATTAASALASLEEARVVWLMLRGQHSWPDVSGDIDLLVRRSDLSLALDVVDGAMRSAGWPVVVRCLHVEVPVMWCAEPAQPDELLEIDVATETSWAFGSFIDETRVLRQRVPLNSVWVPRPGDESALLGVPALLGSETIRKSKGCARWERIRSLVDQDPAGAATAWREAIGETQARAILTCIRDNDFENASIIARRARRRGLAARAVLHPMAATSRVALFVQRRVRMRASCGLWETAGGKPRPVRYNSHSVADWAKLLRRVQSSHPR